MVNEFDQIGEAEFMYGGNWLDYHLSDSTDTGIYSSPVPNPGVTTTQDDAGTFYYWNESNYQADNNTGWGLTTK